MNRLKLLRAGRYTQAEMAKLLGVSRATYTKYENGALRLTEEHLRALSKILGVSVDAILGEPESGDDPLWDAREALRRDPERRILFSLARDASIDEVRRAVAAIDEFRREREGRGDDAD